MPRRSTPLRPGLLLFGLAAAPTQRIYDVLAGAPPVSEDSLATLRRLVEEERHRMQADLERRAARPQTTPLPPAAYAGTYQSPLMGSLVLATNGQGNLEARAGAAWSAVEVYDGARHQLRVELFGSGSVLTMEVEGQRVVAATLRGVRYQRAR